MPVSPRILLACASIAEIERIESYLSSREYDVRSASDGAEALACMGDFKPHLVLLDADLAGSTAFDICKQVKQDPDLNKTIVLMATALSKLGDIERAVEAGTDDFLSKPVNKTELLKRVNGLLGLVDQVE